VEEKKEEYWSRFAHSYERDGEYVAGKAVLQKIQEILAKGSPLGKAIEFGCGTGYFTKTIASFAANIVASDLSDEMLEISRSNLKAFRNISIHKADCTAAPFPSERFDTVIMINLIHVIENPFLCLKECQRILQKGGRIIAADLTRYGLNLYQKMKLSFRYLRCWGLPPRRGKNNMSPGDFVFLMENAGFEVVDVQLIKGGANAIFLKAQKK